MALDPNIALGVRPLEVPNQLAQYGQIQQLMAARDAQQLNALKMQEAQAAMEERNALRRLNPSAPDYEQQLFKVSPQLGINYRKEAALTAAQEAARKKSEFDLKAAQRKFGDDLKRNLSANPSDENVIAWGQDAVLQGIYTENQVASTVQQLLALPPQRRASILSQAGATAGELKPVTSVAPTGIVQTPAFGGPATIVSGTEAAFQMTPAQIAANKIAQQQLGVSQSQLGLAQAKFAFEKANPTLSIQEDPSGLLAVNTRTGVATPIVYGSTGFQAAPAVAPGASMMRQPPAALPGQRTAAIPGMTSVLDQTAMPLVAQGGERMPGMPVAGKEKPMTETQSNATAYGMRMKEANSILEDLAKKGVLKGAVIEATPLIGGALGQVLPSALGGTSAAQQQVNQAKSNFITAVLRKESGAVISDSEFDREDKKYFPQINDNASVIKQKENARKLAIKAIEVQAGPGAKEIQKYQPSVGGGVDTSNPLLR
jgi:Ni,Fe-hydrogenase III small subunit